MTISIVVGYAIQFFMKAFITNVGSLDDVGLYQAGWAINASYLGVVFTAMSKDYFPRISSISKDYLLLQRSVNEQGEIAILIICPLIIWLMVFIELCIRILYAETFLSIIPMVRWMLIGSILRAGSYALAYVYLAKGDGRKYLFNELFISFVATLPAYLVGYQIWGLVGVGYAFVFSYAAYFGWLVIRAKKQYNIYYQSSFWYLMLILTLPVVAFALFDTFVSDIIIRYSIGLIISISITLFAFIEIKKRLFTNEAA